MAAELLKIRSMPTPLWCGIVIAALFLAGLVVTAVWGAGGDLDTLTLIQFPTAICSVVLGVWIFGVEYGQNTMRRTVAADPDRVRLVAVKLGAALLVVAVVTVLVFMLALALYGLANSGHDFEFPVDDLFRRGADSLFSNLVYMLVGAGFAMITASMAGGMAATLVFIFVLDGMLSLLPKVGDFTFGLAVADLSAWITGSDAGGLTAGAGHSPGIALLIVAAWVCLLLGAGANRLIRSDVK